MHSQQVAFRLDETYLNIQRRCHINYVFAPLVSLYIYGQSSYFRNFIARSKSGSFVSVRDAAKSGKERRERTKKGIPVLDYQNRARARSRAHSNELESTEGTTWPEQSKLARIGAQMYTGLPIETMSDLKRSSHMLHTMVI